jgi:hypothetical protein
LLRSGWQLTPPRRFRRQVLNLLALIAGLSVLRALWALSAT